MRIDVVLAKLNKIKLGIKPEYCLGCGCENSCSVRGCAVIRAAIEALKAGGDIRVPTSEGGGDCDGRDAELQGLHTPDSDLPRS